MDKMKRYIKVPSTITVEDISGNIYGYLTAVKYSESRNHRVFWECLCACGNTFIARTDSLKKGKPKSCGCIQQKGKIQEYEERGIFENTAYYEGAKPKEYAVWTGIKQRCLNPDCPAYKNYGGRGIQICERWKNSFELFIEDMGHRPTATHSIERIDNHGPYSPENCKWATKKEQQRNLRTNRFVEYKGRKMLLIEFSEMVNLNFGTVKHHLKKGRTPEEIAATALVKNMPSAALIPHTFGFIV